jgi:hypothetical protein
VPDLLFGPAPLGNRDLWVSLGFGVGMIGLGWLVAIKAREDFAFWLYLFGLSAFWLPFAVLYLSGDIAGPVWAAANLGLVFLSLFLQRPEFTLAGGVGLFVYLARLAHDVFRDSVLFPFALSGLGLVVLAAGVLYQRRRARIEAWLSDSLPPSLRRLRPTGGLDAPG